MRDTANLADGVHVMCKQGLRTRTSYFLGEGERYLTNSRNRYIRRLKYTRAGRFGKSRRNSM